MSELKNIQNSNCPYQHKNDEINPNNNVKI